MPRPTRPGDVLHVEIVPSRAHPGGGTVVACGETCNQRRKVVQITTVGLIVAAPKLGCRSVLRAAADALRRVQMWTFERFPADSPFLNVSPYG